MPLICTPITADSTLYTADDTLTLRADMTEICIFVGGVPAEGSGGSPEKGAKKKRDWLAEWLLLTHR